MASPEAWPATPILDPGQEDPFTGLGRFDTVFLVDDSGSIAGVGWSLARRILERSTRIAMRYDDNGIDIHFLNTESKNRNHVTTSASVTQTLAAITPQGGTPLGHQLQKHLQGYIDNYMDQGGRRNSNTKQLNLIVIADGKPDEPYKRIKKMVVRAAQDLDNERALDTQVGIQFCLIGDDSAAAEFYSSLDNDIEDEQGLNRDVCINFHSASNSSLTQALAPLAISLALSCLPGRLLHPSIASFCPPTLSLACPWHNRLMIIRL